MKVKENMIKVEEFAKAKGMTSDKIVEMIKNEFYTGQVVDEQWYISKYELENSSKNPKIASGTVSTSYGTAHTLMKFFQGIGWIVVLIGAIGIFLAFTFKEGILAVMFGITTIISGLLLVTLSQVTQAILDSSNYLKNILEEIKSFTKELLAKLSICK